MDPATPEQISVRVVYALPERQSVVTVRIERGSSVLDAVRRSGLLDRYPEAARSPLSCAIFGRVIAMEESLRDGDRIEILRPLIVDPKQARRQAAARAKPNS
jgi:putative ubiquitin-RnfH superfamily antitoxin RatB of RatAB toxin-antitoxin module